jgi:hypothetical protein
LTLIVTLGNRITVKTIASKKCTVKNETEPKKFVAYLMTLYGSGFEPGVSGPAGGK